MVHPTQVTNLIEPPIWTMVGSSSRNRGKTPIGKVLQLIKSKAVLVGCRNGFDILSEAKENLVAFGYLHS